MKHLWTLLFVLLAACTVNKKYVEITLDEGATLKVTGNITPEFMRENTSEAQTNTPSTSLEIPLNKVDCGGCHNAYAGDLFKGIQLPDLPEEPDKPPVVDPVDPPVVDPVDPPVVTKTVEKAKYNGNKNKPWLTYYLARKLSEYPQNFTIRLASGKTWLVKVGTRTRKPGHPGADHADYIVKQSDVPGRGMVVLIHSKFGKQDVFIEY